MTPQKDYEVLSAFLVNRRSHRWIEENILGIRSASNWGGTKAKEYLWKFGLKDPFKNFLADVSSEKELEEKIKDSEDDIRKYGVKIELLREVWVRSQSVYVFQRVIHNDNGWVRPSEGRLGFPDDGDYLRDNGFGHEDWNFNTDLSVDGYIYGYKYKDPAVHKQSKKFNIVFATFDNGRWSVVGFYLNAQFSPNGAPYSKAIVEKKFLDIDFLKLNRSLSKEWIGPREKIELKLKDELRCLLWRVHFKDVVVLPNAIDISSEVDLPKNHRITTTTGLTEETFFRILQIAKSTVPNLKGRLTADEKKNKNDRGVLEYIDEDEEDFPEGTLFYRRHRFRERNSALVKAAKERFLEKHGRLFCECCKFNFEDQYGEIGSAFIEAHHVLPVSDLSHSGKTKVEDLAMLCSNCHRMVHRKRPWIALEKLKELLRKRRES